MFALADSGTLPDLTGVPNTGTVEQNEDANNRHIEAILALPEVKSSLDAIANRKFKVCLDTVNGK